MTKVDRAQVDALLHERAGYAARGLPHRVAQVDAALAELGYEPPDEEVPPPVVEEAGGGSARRRSGRRSG